MVLGYRRSLTGKDLINHVDEAYYRVAAAPQVWQPCESLSAALGHVQVNILSALRSRRGMLSCNARNYDTPSPQMFGPELSELWISISSDLRTREKERA